MPRDEFDDARDAVFAAPVGYRIVLTYDDASNALNATGLNPWIPIYSQLLTELGAALQVSGHRSDRLAEVRLINQADRFDWRS